MVMIVEPVTLSSDVVRLEPLGKEHASGLYEAGQDEDIWTYMPLNACASYETLMEWISAAHAPHQLPFAIIDATSGKPVGSSRYLNIAEEHYGLEIGWTWLTPRVQRTGVNTECKYLLLRHAFETLGAIRVQLKTDKRNVISQGPLSGWAQ